MNDTVTWILTVPRRRRVLQLGPQLLERLSPHLEAGFLHQLHDHIYVFALLLLADDLPVSNKQAQGCLKIQVL